MSCATKSVVSVAGNGGCCLASVSPAKISSLHPCLALPQKPIKLNLSCSQFYSFTPLSVSIFSTKRGKFPTIVSVIRAQQQGDETLVLDQEDDLEEEEFDEDEEFDFEGGDSVEATAEDGDEEFDFEGGDSVEATAETGDEGLVEEVPEDDYQEPSEDAKLFIGNLPYDVDSEQLAQLLQQAGVVEIAEVIYNRETDQSRGFGFVTMSTVAEAEKAVEMFNRYDLNGRVLTVNKASPRGSRPERTPREYEPAYRIYVGNLPWDVDDGRLEQMFSEHGKVVNARVVYDRDSGRSRGFGFITMSNESDMNDAIANLDGKSLNGRSIRVNAAEERPRRF